MSELPKPSRTFSKRLTLATFGLSWVTLFASMALGKEIAAIVVPAMVMLIASAVGIYQGVGHMDLRAIAQGVQRSSFGVNPSLVDGDDAPEPK